MRPRPPRLRCEALEDRLTPTAIGQVISGTLVLSGTPDGPIVVEATSNTTYTVTDDGVAISNSPFTINATTGGLTFNLANGGQDIVVDMNTFTLPRNIQATMGSVANGFLLREGAPAGAVAGNVQVSGKNGAFMAVELASDAKVNGSFTVNHGAGDTLVTVDGAVVRDVRVAAVSPNAADATQVNVGAASAIGGNFTVDSAANGTGMVQVALAAGSTVGGSALVSFSSNTSTVTAAGAIAKNLTITAFNNTSNASVVAVVDGTLAGGLAVGVGLNNNGNGNLTVDTSVGGGVTYIGGRTGDTVLLTANADVARAGSFQLGGGNDTLTINGKLNTSMGSAITQGIFVDAGAGDDEVTLNSVIRGSGSVLLGAGNDLLTLAAGYQSDTFMSGMNTFSRIATNGGSGTDTLTGYTGQDVIFLSPSSRNGDYEFDGTAMMPFPPPTSPPVSPVPPATVVVHNFSGNKPAP